ncbi:hypothetical protein HOLleu_04140 [Holothuria leucospilota]|uniref:Uncharacterized protein n=1 Tax=Holothuria leucospilota TaxID=206669 RepID=A0A9Q1HI21_HOLLE|nr:hypothetical protein HOLleu_04140 [Holothuria leucospilota]
MNLSDYTLSKHEEDVLQSSLKFYPFRPLDQVGQKTHVNLPSAQTQAIKKLRRNTDIVIRPADKGGATTILNTADYVKEAEQQLSNCHFYKLLQDDPSGSFQSKVGTLCNQLSENGAATIKELIHRNPRLGIFYTLPKIHKLPQLLATHLPPNFAHLDQGNLSRERIRTLAVEHKILPPPPPGRPIIS